MVWSGRYFDIDSWNTHSLMGLCKKFKKHFFKMSVCVGQEFPSYIKFINFLVISSTSHNKICLPHKGSCDHCSMLLCWHEYYNFWVFNYHSTNSEWEGENEIFLMFTFFPNMFC